MRRLPHPTARPGQLSLLSFRSLSLSKISGVNVSGRRCVTYSVPAVLDSDAIKVHKHPACRGREIRRALVITKTSRYHREAERLSLSGPALHAEMTRMGLNVDTLLASRDMHEQGVLSLLNALHRNGISSRLIRHTEFECIDTDDVVISAGGDGTFLQSARRIRRGGPPILGVNTDSSRSKGFFCRMDASRPESLNRDIPRLLTGNFAITQRCRMKVTLTDIAGDVDETSIPYVLNEAFFAERDASKPSNLAICLDDEPKFTNYKSSGIVVSTGSGSTGWMCNIAKVTPDQVARVISAIGQPALEAARLMEITKKVNKERLLLPSDQGLLQYIIREPLFADDLHSNFGRVRHIAMRSLGDNAVLTADGMSNVSVAPGVVVDVCVDDDARLNCISFPHFEQEHLETPKAK